MTFFDDVFSQILLFHSISNRVWWSPKIDRRLVFRKMHLFLALYRQYKRLAQDAQIRIWIHLRGLLRLEISDFGLSSEVFWRPFRGLSRLEISDFGLSWEAFLASFPRALAIRNQRFRALLGGFFGVLSEGSCD